MVAKANAGQVPNDSATQAVIKEMTRRFNWGGLDYPTRFVLMSLVAGARAPDTKGFSVIDIDHIRGAQLTDSAQATHMLRRAVNDGPDGNISSIAQTRAQITSFLNSTLSSWAVGGSLVRPERWTFPFYGEQTIQVFSPAFDIGQISHSIEDSYSHTLRDDNFQIVAVANYIELMENRLNEERDGPPHSDRLDQCNMNDTFDSMRITELHRQAVRVYTQLDSLLQSNTTDDSSIETILDDIYVYRSGCPKSTEYCGSAWQAKANEATSKPYKLGFNCNLVKPEGRGGSGPGPGSMQLTLAALLLFIPIAVATALKKRVA